MIKSFLCMCLGACGLVLALTAVAAAGTPSGLVITVAAQGGACNDQAQRRGKDRTFSPAPDLGGRLDAKRPKSRVIPGLLI